VKSSRRIKRMSRNRVKVTKMNLTSLMDVFTILVFFLLVNSASTEVLETPKQITLPDSVVEEKPRETVVIFVSPDVVTVQGKSVARVEDILATDQQNIAPIGERLAELSKNVIGLRTRNVAESQEVTILADRSVPFTVVKKVMSTCTSQGYGQISLAVLQKAPKTDQVAQS
jgi:biopolymer transport protein ExbD